jgi:hypothetical protein
MENQPKKSEENKAKSITPVVITTIIATLIVVGIVWLVFSSGSSPSAQEQSVASNNGTNPSVQTQSPAQAAPQQPAQPQNANDVDLVALKSACATGGANYFKNYQQEFGSPSVVWQTPEYHYDTKLNTCLVYIGWDYVTYQSPLDINSPNFTVDLIVYNFVFDVYSNQAMLQNVVSRTSTNGQNTDTLSSSPNYTNIANVDWATFNQQMQVLMSE